MRIGGLWRIVAALTLLGGALTVATPSARAAAIVVTSLADPTGAAGSCTLRDALAAANTNAPVGGCLAGGGADAITFQSGLAGTITLAAASGQLFINSDVTLTGPPGGITISGGDAVRVFTVDSGTVALSNLTIADGNATDGAGTNGDSIGGGLANINATIAISGVTFVNNRTRINSQSAGGAIANAFGTMTIANSTFGGNASENGGAVYAQGSTRITNSTFAGNSAPQGAAVYGGGVTLQNTIVAEAGNGCFGIANDGGNNLDEGTSCGFGSANGSISGQPARLGPLANNGGPTQTRALLGGSAAIDAGDPATCAAAPVNGVDQRGIPRPRGLRCDIGAFEVGPPNPAPTITGLATTPSPIVAGAGGSVVLTVTGTNFVSGFSTIAINGSRFVNGSILTTTYVSPTQLTTTFSAFPREGAGAYTVTVTTSAPGGGTSNPLTLTVQNPAPTLTGIAPTLAGTSTPGVLVGGGATTLTLTGTAFTPGATVQFDGTTLTPTAANIVATSISFTVPASLLTVARVVAVAVTNPGPGGGTSGSVNFTVANPAPTLASLDPASATAGDGSLTLLVGGTGFVAGSAIDFGGQRLDTAPGRGGQLVATIPAAALRAAGQIAVRVITPGPGGGTSDPLTFVVNPAGAAQLAVAAGSPQRAPVTVAFGTNLAVTVRDQYGNPVADGTVVTFAAPAVGPSGTFAGGGTTSTATTVGGVATAPAFTANGAVGAYTVVASGVGGAVPCALTNTPGPATHFDVSAPATVTAGAALSLTVVARDASGNAATGYTGTVRLTSGDGAATLPGDYAFTAGDAGTHTFSVTLRTGGAQTITVTATADAALTATATVNVAAPPAAPQASVAPATLAFGAQTIGTASDSQQVTLTNSGGSALTIAGVTLTGANPGDFAVTFNTCAGNVPAGGSCVVGVRFAPPAATARSATLSIADNAAGSPQTVALSGTGTTPPASPAPQAVVTASATGGGSVTPAGSTGYATGSVATYAAVPAAGQTFVGWTLDGTYVGYASPLTLTVNGNRTLVAAFVATPTFADVPSNDPDYRALATLAALGIVNSAGVNGSGQFQPDRPVARAEVAAFLARAFGWEREFHGNPFPDKCAPAGTACVDDALWNAVAALRDYGVVGGYTDPATCQASDTTAPCYLPRESVLRVQVVSVVARAFTKAPDLRPTGTWDRLATVAGQYANVPDAGTQRSDLATYRANAGPVPGQATDAAFPAPTDPASRRFVIQALWQAMQATFGTDRVP